MGRIASVLYGVVVYILFLLTFLYAIAFVGDLPVPKTIDSGENGPIAVAVIVDLLLLGLFAVQHSVMARWSDRPSCCSPALHWDCCTGSGGRCNSLCGR